MEVRLEDLVAKVEDLPALPVVVGQVMRLTEDPDSTAMDLGAVIGRDQALTARVLRLANSAYYGFPRRVGTVTEAVVLLGFNTIRNLVLAASVSNVLLREAPGYQLARGELWRHSLTSAMAARLLARKVRYRGAEEAFVAGLLHDIGKLVLSQYVGETYAQIWERVTQERLPFMEAERATLGFDHAQAGGLVAEKWNLPEALVEAVSLHHQPAAATKQPMLAVLAHAGDALALMLGAGLGADGLNYPLDAEAVAGIGLTEESMEEVLTELADSLADEASYQP
ncbi:MAG: HDOD domain-containing protein [Clostridia bacterium]|jgi:putative nucleotidyltransferase with HDIG domain|nr:HDOD domain-containing protein [Clostridia bacterium]MDH7572323.1 HDOD domain-containing protein [Clostridia bacterium]